MAKFNIFWSERKSGNYGNYMVADLIDDTGQKIEGVSINEKSKKGDVFPNFSGIITGQDVEGELWTSDAGKHYLFPPKKKLDKPNFMKKNIEDAINLKNDNIGKVMDRKEESIALAGAQRDAVLIATTIWNSITSANSNGNNVSGGMNMKEEIIKWRNWFLSDDFKKDVPPF